MENCKRNIGIDELKIEIAKRGKIHWSVEYKTLISRLYLDKHKETLIEIINDQYEKIKQDMTFDHVKIQRDHLQLIMQYKYKSGYYVFTEMGITQETINQLYDIVKQYPIINE